MAHTGDPVKRGFGTTVCQPSFSSPGRNFVSRAFAYQSRHVIKSNFTRPQVGQAFRPRVYVSKSPGFYPSRNAMVFKVLVRCSRPARKNARRGRWLA